MKSILQKIVSILCVIGGILFILDFFIYRHCEIKFYKDITFGVLLLIIGYQSYKKLSKGKKVGWLRLLNEYSGVGYGPLIISKDDERNSSRGMSWKMILYLILFFLAVFTINLLFSIYNHEIKF